MTTRVEIKNPRDNMQSIDVFKGDNHIGQVPPGDHLVTHIWEGMNLTIKEVSNASIST